MAFMSDAAAATNLLDGLRVAFLFALLGVSSRSMVATTAFVLGCRAASRDIVLILFVGAMIGMAALVAERFLVALAEMSPALRLGFWVIVPCALVASLAAWVMTKTGRVWQALLTDAELLWKIGHDAESAALRALIFALALMVLAGVILTGEPKPSLAGWTGLLAMILLTINRGAIEMTVSLFIQGALVGIAVELYGEPGGLLAAVVGVTAIAAWQHRGRFGVATP